MSSSDSEFSFRGEASGRSSFSRSPVMTLSAVDFSNTTNGVAGMTSSSDNQFMRVAPIINPLTHATEISFSGNDFLISDRTSEVSSVDNSVISLSSSEEDNWKTNSLWPTTQSDLRFAFDDKEMYSDDSSESQDLKQQKQLFLKQNLPQKSKLKNEGRTLRFIRRFPGSNQRPFITPSHTKPHPLTGKKTRPQRTEEDTTRSFILSHTSPLKPDLPTFGPLTSAEMFITEDISGKEVGKVSTWCEIPPFFSEPSGGQAYVQYGPIIGSVSQTSARVMIQLQKDGHFVKMWAVDKNKRDEFASTPSKAFHYMAQGKHLAERSRLDERNLPEGTFRECVVPFVKKGVPTVFEFKDLEPGTQYIIKMNVCMPRLASASFRTLVEEGITQKSVSATSPTAEYHSDKAAYIFGNEIMYHPDAQVQQYSKDPWQNLYKNIMNKRIFIVIHDSRSRKPEKNSDLLVYETILESASQDCRVEDALNFLDNRSAFDFNNSNFQRHVLANAPNVFLA